MTLGNTALSAPLAEDLWTNTDGTLSAKNTFSSLKYNGITLVSSDNLIPYPVVSAAIQEGLGIVETALANI